MAEARRRVHERFGIELEHEVRFLGPARAAAAVGEGHRRAAKFGRVAARRDRALPAPLRLPAARAVAPTLAGCCRRAGRSSSPRRSSCCAAAAMRSPRETSVFAVRTARDRRRLATRPGRGARRRSRPSSAGACSGSRAARSTAGSRPLPDVMSRHVRPPFPHTLRVTVAPERPVLLLRRGNERAGSSRRADG